MCARAVQPTSVVHGSGAVGGDRADAGDAREVEADIAASPTDVDAASGPADAHGQPDNGARQRVAASATSSKDIAAAHWTQRTW